MYWFEFMFYVWLGCRLITKMSFTHTHTCSSHIHAHTFAYTSHPLGQPPLETNVYWACTLVTRRTQFCCLRYFIRPPCAECSTRVHTNIIILFEICWSLQFWMLSRSFRGARVWALSFLGAIRWIPKILKNMKMTYQTYNILYLYAYVYV